MKSLTTIFILLFIAIIFSNCNIKGGSFQKHTVVVNSKSKIVINAYNEICPMICGAYYDFESNHSENYFSQLIFQFRHDDPVEIETKNIKVVSENLTYFWMGWKFAVTIDEGQTWTTWDASEYEEFDINYGLIEKVEVKENGKGKMTFNKLGRNENKILYLSTKDFGKTWQKP